ncbi:hypothetical protein M231_01167 [Tremella mesenterica]|uniref:UNC-45/Cro1/She4 central domain-containing protein n=1 Tax=Tremella mesenterica TaxID=5217 RepID=A0A4Q1BTP8_TREME|nr:hypothetical protein M231_01167 [Tremella mesenterica]
MPCALADISLQDDVRIEAGHTDLPRLVSKVVSLIRHELPTWTHTRQDLGQLAEQQGRVVANFVADCDLVCDATYPENVIDLIHESAISFPMSTYYSLLASLVNLVIDGHERSINALLQTSAVSVLTKLAKHAMLASSPPGSEPISSGVMEWSWSVIDIIVNPTAEPDETNLQTNVDTIQDLYSPLSTIPIVSDFIPADFNHTSPFCLVASRVLEVVASANLTSLPALLLGARTMDIYGKSQTSVLYHMLSFIETTPTTRESGTVTEGGGQVLETGHEDADATNTLEQTFKQIQTNLIHVIIHLSTGVATDETSFRGFWDSLREWLRSGSREELVECALVAFGNGSAKDQLAIDLITGERSLLPVLVELLEPTSPPRVQHALIGLLRNLSVPAGNRLVLGQAGVISRLGSMEAFRSEKQLPSVHRGAVEILKLLCRDNLVNTLHVVGQDGPLKSVFSLYDTCADPAVRAETGRLLVNLLHSLSKSSTSESAEGLRRLCSVQVCSILCDLSKEGSKHPVLVNEAVIGLNLLVTFGRGDIVNMVRNELESGTTAPETESTCDPSALRALILFMERPGQSMEIRHNCETLLSKLGVQSDAGDRRMTASR